MGLTEIETMKTCTDFERAKHNDRQYIDIPVSRVAYLSLYGYVFTDRYGSFIKQSNGDKLYLLNYLVA